MTNRLAEIKARWTIDRPNGFYCPHPDIAWLIVELERRVQAEGHDTLSSMLRDTEPHGNG